MVLKNFINYLLNKYLKNYVEKLDYEKLKIGLKHGNIYLENLHLRPEALAYLNLPATVAVGFIEKLKVSIPWNALSSTPTEIHIDGFYLLIVPKNELAQDLSEHYADKMKRVQLKSEHLRKALSNEEKYDNKEMALLERMRLQMMQNINIKIRHLHISYEMKSPSKLGHPFSFGLTIHFVHIATASNPKLNRRVKGNTLLTYKFKEMNSVAIYWVTKCRSRLNVPFQTVLDDLKSKVATDNYIPMDKDIKYILYPINLQSESLITLKPKEHHYERSSIIVDIQLDEINLYGDSEQISDVLDFIKYQNYTTVYDRCREYRELLLQQTRDPQSLTGEQKQRLHFIESKLDVFHLAYNRHRVEMEAEEFSSLSQEQPQQDHQETNKQPMMTTLDQATTTISRHLNRWDSLAKIKNNFTSIGKNNRKGSATSQIDQKKQTFEDTAKIDLEINIHNLRLNLLSPSADIRSIVHNGNNASIMSFNVIDARVAVKQMCISSRVECSIEFQSGQILGMEDEKEKRRSIILSPSSSSMFSPFISIDFELFCANRKSDYRFCLNVEPIKFLYHPETFNRLVKNFEANGETTWKTKALMNHTEAQVERDLSSMKLFDMTLHLKGASLSIPQDLRIHQEFSVIRLDFGKLLFKSSLDNNDDHTDHSLFQNNHQERRLYKKYKLELSDLQILYFYSIQKGFSLLRRTPLIDINFYKCVYSNDLKLPKWRIAMQIAMGDIQLSSKALAQLIVHLQSIPSVFSNILSIIKRVNHFFVLFSPEASLAIDLLIYNSTLRLLTHPQRSIRTDFHIYFDKIRDEIDTNQRLIIELNDIIMSRALISNIQQSSRTFYRNDHLKLRYENSTTKL